MDKRMNYPGKNNEETFPSLEEILRKRMYRNRLVTVILPVVALLLFIVMIVADFYKH